MNEIVRTKEEYGGFLPLELNFGYEWFEEYKENLLRFNSVKASLSYLIKEKNLRKMLIPYYYCPSTSKAICKTGIDMGYYHICDSLLPDFIEDTSDTCVLLVDYFGVRSTWIKDIADSFQKANVIIDNAHAFFSEPLMRSNVYNIYSAKKFFGIPDGSYIIGKDITSIKQNESYSSEYANFLLMAYERGTNVAYQEKKNADNVIAQNYMPMSSLAIGLLQNVDYKFVKNRRTENFGILRDAFADVNKIGLPEECVPYQFPLLLGSGGVDIKRRLIKEKIYVSTLWSGEKLLEEGNEFELDMSRNAIFLPIDQRYEAEDMKYIEYIVKEIMDENT